MDERGPERSLALAGIVGVVLLAVSALMQGSLPKPDDPVGKVAEFLVDQRDQIRWAGFIGALGSIVLLGWVGAVWRLMRAPRAASRCSRWRRPAARCSRWRWST